VPEALTQVAVARLAWRSATEQARQRALAADAELRRRHPEIEVPPLHPRATRRLGEAGPMTSN
jgi:hypothetical protein